MTLDLDKLTSILDRLSPIKQEMSEEEKAKLFEEMSEEEKAKLIGLMTVQADLLTEQRRLLEQPDEDDYYFDGEELHWEDETWFNFYWTAREIVKLEGVSLGVAQRTLRELCATGDVRSIKSSVDEQPLESEIIKPSEWVKDQVDLAEGIFTWIFVSREDVQCWLDNQAKAAGRPIREIWINWTKEAQRQSASEEPTEPTSVVPVTSVKARTSRKLGLARTAIKDLWSGQPPEALTNPQIEKQVDDWITAYCKKTNQARDRPGYHPPCRWP
jgi:hypothetical protein